MPIHVLTLCALTVIYVLITYSCKLTNRPPPPPQTLRVPLSSVTDVCLCVFVCVVGEKEHLSVDLWATVLGSCTVQLLSYHRSKGIPRQAGRGWRWRGEAKRTRWRGEGGEKPTQWGDLNEARCTDVSRFGSPDLRENASDMVEWWGEILRKPSADQTAREHAAAPN